MNGVRIDILSRLIGEYRETKRNPVVIHTKKFIYYMTVGENEHGIYKKCTVRTYDKRTGYTTTSDHLISIEYL